MFRVFFLFHRKLLSQLSRCAWKSICQYLEVSLSEKLQPAGILSIATAGDFLDCNPHIHALIASAVFRADSSFVTVPLFQENVLRELFEANVFKLLISEGLITAELIAKMRAWKHSGFHVYAGPTISHKEDAVRVGLYIVRAPASASRLALTEDGLLKYLAKGSIPNDNCDPLFEPNGQILDPLEWIAKLTLHIPDPGAQPIPYCGRYSNVSRAKASRCAQLPDHSTQSLVPKEDSDGEWLKERKSIWAAFIKLIYESHPLLCPKCHTQMKVISLIKDGTVIDKILHHLEYKFDVLPLLRARHRLRFQFLIRTSSWIRLSGQKEIKPQRHPAPRFYRLKSLLFLPRKCIPPPPLA